MGFTDAVFGLGKADAKELVPYGDSISILLNLFQWLQLCPAVLYFPPPRRESWSMQLMDPPEFHITGYDTAPE